MGLTCTTSVRQVTLRADFAIIPNAGHCPANGIMIERLEAVLKRALEEPFARIFPGRLHPLELAAELRDAARDSRVRTADGTFVANSYLIFMAAEDCQQLTSIGETVCGELVEHLRSYSDAEEWQIGPYVTVQLQPDPELSRSQVRTEAGFAACPETAYLHAEAGLPEAGRCPIGTETIIGRSGSCGTVIDSPEISRRHSRITYRYVQYEIEDLNSANGTFVNGEQVQRATLFDGDLIEIGLVQLRFFVE